MSLLNLEGECQFNGADVATVTGLSVGYANADERRYRQDLPVTLVVANIPCSEALDFDD